MSLLNRELDYFLAICETRNLGRAAETLGVSQPALTRSLQRLEAHFGAKLFVRAPRGVELTPIGTALRARVDKARITLDDAEREVEQLGAGKIGKVRIGVGHMLVRLVSQALFPRFIVERPAAQVQFHVGFNAELFGLVQAGNLDFSVCGLLETVPNLVFRELLVSDLVVVVRQGHPLTKIESPTIRDLAAFRSVAPSAGVPARQLVEAQLAKHGFGNRMHAVETQFLGGNPRRGRHHGPVQPGAAHGGPAPGERPGKWWRSPFPKSTSTREMESSRATTPTCRRSPSGQSS